MSQFSGLRYSPVVLAVFFSFVCAPKLNADVTGSILGAVTDAGGGVLPGVEVIATNLETNQKQSTRSDNVGQYRILALPVGKYRVEASAAGFQKFVATGIELTVNQQRRVDILLQVGNVEQQVEVSAASLQVETTATQLGDVVEEKKMLALPLNGRSYTQLVTLDAGVSDSSSASASRGVSGGNLTFSGSRSSSNNFFLDGTNIMDAQNRVPRSAAGVQLGSDSVLEVQVFSANYAAEYGRNNGGVMNSITRSGSNEFHGTFFEYFVTANSTREIFSTAARNRRPSSAICLAAVWADRS